MLTSLVAESGPSSSLFFKINLPTVREINGGVKTFQEYLYSADNYFDS